MARNQGIKSRNVKQVPVRTGQPSYGVNVRSVSQVGQSLGDHATEGKSVMRPVEPYKDGRSPVGAGVPLGNLTSKTAGQGPGSGRTVSKCGSQQGVSPSTPIGPTKDTLAGK
jgi:hypothetical protein